ncbi:MAG: oligosaccharide flippase family protein [Oscillospiraceae bacterium]|jgi:O-antigen/teichoic acid export membrane protein|nr:oligosaccharide flippase family protein [Oscillospiraceae bacterium]
MAKVNQLKAGAFISYFQLALSNIIPLIYTPIMLSKLGQGQYGLFTTAQSVLAMLALLNFGIGGTITRYVTRAIALGDKEAEEKIVGVFFTIYSVISALILTVGCIVAFNLRIWYGDLSDADFQTFQLLVFLMVANTVITLPFSVFSCISVSHERFIFNKGVNLLTSVFSPALNLAMLFMGFASVGLVLANTIISFISYALYVFYSIKVLKIKPRFKGIDWSILKEIFAFSAFMFLGEISNLLYWQTDKLMLTSMVGPEATAVYNIGATFNTYMQNFSIALISVLVPRIMKMVTLQASKKELTDVFVKTGRLQFIILGFLLSAFLVLGRQFIGFWAGAGYEDAYIIALLVMIPVCIPLIQSAGLQMVVAQNKHRFRAIMFAAISVLHVVAAFFIIPHFGIIGCAVNTCVCFIIGPVIVMNFYYHFKTGINIPLFWWNILKMSFVPAIFTVLGFIYTEHFPINSLWEFLGVACLYTAAFIFPCYFLMMNRYEKDIFKNPIVGIILKLKAKIKKA